jgi:AcrR family transcriptional regulator
MTAAASGSRRSAGDRRAQLVEIGLQLLPTTPVQELTIDEVARRAGISRSLLFHYFPTKRDYYAAVTRAAARALEEHLLPGSETPAAELVPGMLDRYVGWVETYRESYLAVVRGAAGGDPWVAEVYEETRERLVDLALAALDKLDEWTERTLRHVRVMDQALGDIRGITIPATPPDRTHVYYQYCVYGPKRDELVVRCVRRGIDIETLHVDVCSDMDLFKNERVVPSGTPGARRASGAMQIPVYSTMTDEQAQRVARVVRGVLARA